MYIACNVYIHTRRFYSWALKSAWDSTLLDYKSNVNFNGSKHLLLATVLITSARRERCRTLWTVPTCISGQCEPSPGWEWQLIPPDSDQDSVGRWHSWRISTGNYAFCVQKYSWALAFTEDDMETLEMELHPILRNKQGLTGEST